MYAKELNRYQEGENKVILDAVYDDGRFVEYRIITHQRLFPGDTGMRHTCSFHTSYKNATAVFDAQRKNIIYNRPCCAIQEKRNQEAKDKKMKNNNTKFDKRLMVNLSKATTALVTTSALLATPVLLTPDLQDYLMATGLIAMLCVGIPYASNGYKDLKSVGRIYVDLYDNTANNIRNITCKKTKTK